MPYQHAVVASRLRPRDKRDLPQVLYQVSRSPEGPGWRSLANARAVCSLKEANPQLEIKLAGQPVTPWVMWVQNLLEGKRMESRTSMG